MLDYLCILGMSPDKHVSEYRLCSSTRHRIYKFSRQIIISK